VRIGAGGLAAAVVLALAPAAGAQTPAPDSVTGSAAGPPSQLTIIAPDAHSAPSGENPSGTATWHAGGGEGPTWNVQITCLHVTGRTAVAGFSGTVSFFLTVDPVAGLFRVVDGGGPGSSQDTFEWAQTEGPDRGAAIPGPTSCASYPASFTPSIVGVTHNVSGDLVVADGAPPVTRAQCRQGGWAPLGFADRSQCVEAVRHLARVACTFERVAHGRPAFRAKYGANAMRNCVQLRIGP
jgi:hypothetical protein